MSENSINKIDSAFVTERDVLNSLIIRMNGKGISGDYRKVFVADDPQNIITPIEDFLGMLRENGYNNNLVVIDCRKITCMENLKDMVATLPSGNGGRWNSILSFKNLEAFDPSSFYDHERRYCLDVVRNILRNDSGEEPPAIACVNSEAVVSQEFIESIFQTSFVACSRFLDDRFQQIIVDCWNDYKDLEYDPKYHIVRDVVPVLWFGDLKGYEKSAKKIVSVGLNPSDFEFQGNRTDAGYSLKHRFPDMAEKGDNTDLQWIERYADAMNRYFRINPYKRWFSSIERPLNCLGASFYEENGFENRAVHIDCCAPVATSPTWGRLPQEEKDDLMGRFAYCFKEMMRLLNPDIVLVSVARTLADEIFGNAQSLWKATPKKGYNYELLEGRNPANGTPVMYVLGRNNRGTPFGGVSAGELEEMFQQIKDIISQREKQTT